MKEVTIGHSLRVCVGHDIFGNNFQGDLYLAILICDSYYVIVLYQGTIDMDL